MSLEAAWFRHRGVKLVGLLGCPAGGRRAPGVLLLHGFPGAERNADVARALLLRGVSVFVLHCRGAWGSEGVYRCRTLVEDAQAGLEFLRSRPGVDRGRIGVFGFSMGGWTALHLAARRSDLRAVCAVAPVGRPGRLSGRPLRDFIRAKSGVLRAGDPGDLARDYEMHVRAHDPVEAVVRIAPRPLLLVHGDRDEVVLPAVSRRLYDAAPGPKRLVIVRGAGHSFFRQRERLCALAAGWFKEAL